MLIKRKLNFQLNIDSVEKDEKGKLKRDQNGYVTIPAYATRIGVFKYAKKDGSIFNEARLPENVFIQESLDTLKNKPVTKLHPEVMVNAKNYQKFLKGVSGEIVGIDGDKIKINITIYDEKLIQDIESGKLVELSCGYTCVLIIQPGTFNGEAYDGIQTEIIYNHIALVPRGRAGPEVKLILDSRFDGLEIENFDQDFHIITIHPQEEPPLYTIKIDGKDVEVTKEVYDAYIAGQTALTNAKKERDQIKGKFDELDLNLKKIQQEKADSEKNAAIDKLKPFIKIDAADVDYSTLSMRQVHELVIASNTDAKDTTDYSSPTLSDDYIAGRVDGIVNSPVQTTPVKENKVDHFSSLLGKIKEVKPPTKANVDAEDPADKARTEKMTNDAQNTVIGFGAGR